MEREGHRYFLVTFDDPDGRLKDLDAFDTFIEKLNARLPWGARNIGSLIFPTKSQPGPVQIRVDLLDGATERQEQASLNAVMEFLKEVGFEITEQMDGGWQEVVDEL